MAKPQAYLDWTGEPAPDRRSDDRIRTLFQVARILTDGGEQRLCLIRNISSGGLLIETFLPFEPGAHVRIEPKSCDPLSGMVRWMQGKYAGIAFDERIDVEEYLQARQYVEPARIPRAPRVVVSNPARILIGPIWYTAHLCNVSQSGAKVQGDVPFAAGETITVQIDGLPARSAEIRWWHDDCAGLEFTTALPLSELAEWVSCAPRAEAA